jgi:hypothetical protein
MSLLIDPTLLDVSGSFDLKAFGEMLEEVRSKFQVLVTLQLSTGLSDTEIKPKISAMFDKVYALYCRAQDLKDRLILTGASGSVPALEAFQSYYYSANSTTYTIAGIFQFTNASAYGEEWIDPVFLAAPHNYTDCEDIVDTHSLSPSANSVGILIYRDLSDDFILVTAASGMGDAWTTIIVNLFADTVTTAVGVSLNVDVSDQFAELTNMISYVEAMYTVLDGIINP